MLREHPRRIMSLVLALYVMAMAVGAGVGGLVVTGSRALGIGAGAAVGWLLAYVVVMVSAGTVAVRRGMRHAP
jgi:predicted MFS family arabinose efflux permease